MCLCILQRHSFIIDLLPIYSSHYINLNTFGTNILKTVQNSFAYQQQSSAIKQRGKLYMQILLSIPSLPFPKNNLHSFSYLNLNTLHKTTSLSIIDSGVSCSSFQFCETEQFSTNPLLMKAISIAMFSSLALNGLNRKP